MSINAELHIPDLWFDFYARFLPGVAFVSAIRVLITGNFEVPNAIELFIIAFAGYLSALISQPISSRLSIFLELLGEKTLKVDVGYVSDAQQKLGRSTRESLILSKMHAEVNFFCQLSILSIVFQVIQIFYTNMKQQWSPWLFIISFVFVIFAFEVATRRVVKAKKYVRKNEIIS